MRFLLFVGIVACAACARDPGVAPAAPDARASDPGARAAAEARDAAASDDAAAPLAIPVSPPPAAATPPASSAPESPRAALKAHRATWLAKRPRNYHFTYRKTGFVPDSGYVVVVVRDLAVVGVRRDEAPGALAPAEGAPSIDDLFARIEKASSDGATVTYDAVLGYPKSATFTYGTESAGFEVTGLARDP